MKKYVHLEGIVTADAAFDAFGKNLNELFTNAALATTELMIDFKTLKPTIKKTIKLTADNVEKLLFTFIDQIIFLKDAEQLLFKKFAVKITENPPTLIAECAGDKINQDKQKLGMDVKAITYHHFKLEHTNQGWKARIVLDI